MKPSPNSVDIALEEDFLRDILVKEKGEVYSMVLTEFNERLHNKTLLSEGFNNGFSNGFNTAFFTMHLKKSITLEETLEETHLTPEEFKQALAKYTTKQSST